MLSRFARSSLLLCLSACAAPHAPAATAARASTQSVHRARAVLASVARLAPPSDAGFGRRHIDDAGPLGEAYERARTAGR